MRRKVTVVGAGFVGEHVAMEIARRELADVALIDILEGVPQGKALDMYEASPVIGFDSRIIGYTHRSESAGAASPPTDMPEPMASAVKPVTYEVTKNSDVVVITAGLARKPGMSRDDLLLKNAEIVGNVAREVAKYSPQAIIVVVSNPLDVMCWVTLKATGLPKERVIGMAGVLDSARFRTFIAMELGVSVESVSAFVLGGHGDSMVPLPRYSTAGGIPITELMPKERVDTIVQRTRDGGAEIVKLLKTGSAYYAPAASVTEMVDSIFKDKKKILPCAALLSGEYGLSGMYVGVPCVLGSAGLERVIEIKLQADEAEALKRSAMDVKAQQEKLKL
jgi:malate dehydrogenase